MLYEWQIKCGDQVAVYLDHTSAGPHFNGEVKHFPQQTGECWVIQTSDGEIHYIQNFAQIVRCGPPRVLDSEPTWP